MCAKSDLPGIGKKDDRKLQVAAHRTHEPCLRQGLSEDTHEVGSRRIASDQPGMSQNSRLYFLDSKEGSEGSEVAKMHASHMHPSKHGTLFLHSCPSRGLVWVAGVAGWPKKIIAQLKLYFITQLVANLARV